MKPGFCVGSSQPHPARDDEWHLYSQTKCLFPCENQAHYSCLLLSIGKIIPISLPLVFPEKGQVFFFRALSLAWTRGKRRGNHDLVNRFSLPLVTSGSTETVHSRPQSPRSWLVLTKRSVASWDENVKPCVKRFPLLRLLRKPVEKPCTQ